MTFEEWLKKFKKQQANLHLDIQDLELAWKAGHEVGYNKHRRDADDIASGRWR